MRRRLDNEDDNARLARERKEARELKEKGIVPGIVPIEVQEEIPLSPEAQVVEELLEEEIPGVEEKKVVHKRKLFKKKGRR